MKFVNQTRFSVPTRSRNQMIDITDPSPARSPKAASKTAL
jgi:hypothetical protein